jgi:hypothetical protein
LICHDFTNPTFALSPTAHSRVMHRIGLLAGAWLDMNDRSLVMLMTNGIGVHLTNDEKRAHFSLRSTAGSLKASTRTI